MAAQARFRRHAARGLRPQLDLLNPRFEQALRLVVGHFEAEGIRYALAGGLAFGVYGEPRATKGVDFVVGPEAFDVRLGGALVVPRGLPVEAYGVPIDSLAMAVDDPVILEGIERAELFDGVRVLPVEYLAYMKLHSNRARDLQDVAMLLDLADFAPDVLALLVSRSPEREVVEARLARLAQRDR